MSRRQPNSTSFYYWFDEIHISRIGIDSETVYRKCQLVPHGTVLRGRNVQFRSSRKKIKQLDLVKYLNKYGLSTTYKPHFEVHEELNFVHDTLANRKYPLNRIMSNNGRSESSDEIKRIVRHYETGYKDLLPVRCRWLYAYINTEGKCGRISDQWLHRIGRGKHILDSAPRYEDVFSRKYSPFTYHSFDHKIPISSYSPSSKQDYGEMLRNLFQKPGAFLQEFWWAAPSGNRLKRHSHAIAFIYKKPHGYYMDANAGCAICYNKQSLISTCKRFVGTHIEEKFSRLYRFTTYQAPISLSHV